MKNKYLIIPNNLNNVESIRNVGLSTFLFPVEHFSIGYNQFTIDEINSVNVSKYLLVNRILTTGEIDEFIKALPKYHEIKGIFFEDIGIFYCLKDQKYELISYQNHFNTNYHSINSLLDLGVDSAVIANDITLDEIKDIVNHTLKPLVTFIYGKTQIMYSRRNLVKNFNKNYNVNVKDPITHEDVTNISFKFIDSEFGTIVYDNNYYNGTDIVSTANSEKISYYLINLVDLDDSEVNELINYLISNKFNNIKNMMSNTNYGFLYRKTIYKVKRGDDI